MLQNLSFCANFQLSGYPIYPKAESQKQHDTNHPLPARSLKSSETNKVASYSDIRFCLRQDLYPS